MKNIIIAILAFITISSCSKDDYFQDTGTVNPVFNGNIMQYLDSRSTFKEDIFDTLTQVIRYAGMEEIFENDEITFFAPPDPCFIKAIKELNDELYYSGFDTIKSIEEVKPTVWKTFLSQYIIPGDYGMIDFRQVDTTALYAYGGQLYQTYHETEAINVGVIYHDLNNNGTVIKYGGPRQILVSYIPDYSQPTAGWINTFVASSDIQPSNGRVHVLNYNKHIFGFEPSRFASMAIENGIDYK